MNPNDDRITRADIIKRQIGMLDNDTLRQEGVCQSLSRVLANIEIAGCAKTLQEFEKLLAICPFDLAIVISPDNLSQLRKAIEVIHQQSPRTHVIGVVGDISDVQLREFIHINLEGIVSRSSGLQGVLDAISAVEQDRNYVDPLFLTSARMKRMLQMSTVILTDQERAILKLLARGWKNQEIAERMTLSINTIKSYLRSIFQKFYVRTRQEAIHYALKNGFISLEDEDERVR
jgi:DNA-binding NarL/FixJ family response regulator